MTKPKQHTSLTTTLLMLACVSSWLSLAHADKEEEDTSMSLADVVDLVEPFGAGCATPPERSHVEEMVLNKEEASHESKCFRRCMLQQFDVMPEGEQKFSDSKTLEMMNAMFNDKNDPSKIIISKCNNAMAGVTDECENAHSISMCMLREMRAGNYTIPVIKE